MNETERSIGIGALLSLLVVSCVIFIQPGGMGWSDAPEFAVAGAYLDIAHPAGFPLTAHVSNFFGLFSSGPLSFRVQSYSLFLLVLLLLSLTEILRTLTQSYHSALAGAVISLGCLFSIPSFVKQVFTAEAYLLLAVTTMWQFAMLLRFRESNDVRYVYCGAFLSGLAIGNHVVAIFPSALIACVLLCSADVRRRTIIVMLFGLLGLSIYLYLPLRSVSNPPLDTGSPSSIQSFLRHTTAARDRDLRETENADAIIQVQQGQVQNFSERFTSDAGRFAEYFPSSGLVLGVIGAVLLAQISPVALGLLILTAAFNQFFFLGWSDDPWSLSYAIVALLAGLAAAGTIKKVGTLISSRASFLLAPVLPLSFLLIQADSLASSLKVTDSVVGQTPAEVPPSLRAASRFLQDATPGASVLLEYHYFPAIAAQRLLGVRPDLLVLPLPALEFPHYFKSIKLSQSDANVYRSRDYEVPFDALTAFLNLMKRTSVVIEPSRNVNRRLTPATSLLSESALLTFPPKEERVPVFVSRAFADYRASALEFSNYPPTLFGEARSLAEAILTLRAESLEKRGYLEEARDLLELSCQSSELCSHIPLINLASYHLRLEGFATAAELYLKASLDHSPVRSEIFQGLQIALPRLNESEKATLWKSWEPQLEALRFKRGAS